MYTSFSTTEHATLLEIFHRATAYTNHMIPLLVREVQKRAVFKNMPFPLYYKEG
jgi:hypothetical protein